jgi:hypothetical protein
MAKQIFIEFCKLSVNPQFSQKSLILEKNFVFFYCRIWSLLTDNFFFFQLFFMIALNNLANARNSCLPTQIKLICYKNAFLQNV